MKIYFLFVILFFVSGCVSESVYFNNTMADIYKDQSHEKGGLENVVRSYQDGGGYFYSDAPTDRGDVGLWRDKAALDYRSGGNFQDEREKLKADQLIGAIESMPKNKPRELVIFIHGFNVRNAEPDYAYLRELILSRYGRDRSLVFWQVNWDGKILGLMNFRFRRSWSGAQYNAPLVGLRLRGVLNRVLKVNKIPVRVVTHSSGALVASALFGNPAGAFDSSDDIRTCANGYEFFCSHAASVDSNYRIPEINKVSLGLIAPATPFNAFAVFEGIDFSAEAASRLGLLSDNISLVVGGNKDDFALSKLYLPAYPFGATTLGADYGDYNNLLLAIDQKARNPFHAVSLTARYVDFSRSKTFNESFMCFDEHDLSVYLRRQAISYFLDETFK